MGIYAILAWQQIRATRSIAFPVFVPRGNPSVKYGVHRYLSTPSPYPSYFRISPRPLKDVASNSLGKFAGARVHAQGYAPFLATSACAVPPFFAQSRVGHNEGQRSRPHG